jgi:2OG-Fe(II) oxygenase superfamily
MGDRKAVAKQALGVVEDWSNDWSTQLQAVLKHTQPTGTFTTTGCMKPMPFPQISVQGVGKLGFPLMECAVEPLKAVAAKAPFGKGSETILDEKVRIAWQIEADQVTLGGGSVWEDYLKKTVQKACYELGFSEEHQEAIGVHANLYKMLLYEKGGHFKPHRDTEKEDGMFGTLVIQLPSAFTGGDITVWHVGEAKTISLSVESDSKYHYVAFYADCEHQLHPVTSGTRLSLVFNLVALPDKEAPSHSVHVETEAKLRVIVDRWMAEKGSIPRLGYPLEHQYTPNSFGSSSLKGQDSYVLSRVVNAKAEDGRPLFHVTLVLMQRYFEKHFDDDDDIAHDSTSAHLVIDKRPARGTGTKDEWVRLDRDLQEWAMYKREDGWMVPEEHGNFVTSSNARAMDDDWGPAVLFDGKNEMFRDVEPKVEEVYMGNEPESETRWYYAAAIVVSPVEDRPVGKTSSRKKAGKKSSRNSRSFRKGHSTRR